MSTARGALGALIRRNWGLVAVLAAWQLWVSVAGLNSIVLPAPFNVFLDVVSSPELYLVHAGRTLATAAQGLAIGAATGFLLAVLAWSSRLLAGLLTPLGLIFASIPIVALIPIIARLLGYDTDTVIAIVAVATFFPTFVYAAAGLRDLPPGSHDVARVFGTRPVRGFFHLVVPACVPNLMVALRITVPEAVLAAILAEFLIGQSGLGYLFKEAVGQFAMERALGTSLVVTGVAVSLFFITQAAERRAKARWT